jgi:hypothetical protein
MLVNVQHAEKPAHISAATYIQFVVYDKGYLQDFFPGYASDTTYTNISS